MKKTYQNLNADAWYQNCINNLSDFPFAFTYDGVRYEGFSPKFFTEVSRNMTEGDGKISTEIEWELDETLQVGVLVTYYSQYGVCEWTVYFENLGTVESAVLEDAESRLTFQGAYPMVKGILGDHTNWYRPYAMDLTSAPVHFESNSGRPTHVHFPYFNLEYGDCGVMLAIGWSGTWSADFRYNKKVGETTYVAKSVNSLKTVLKPGEKIRTALFVRASYGVREENYATNYWRNWFVEHNLPKFNKEGTPVEPFTSCCLASDTGLPNSDGSISERYSTWRPSLEKMIEEDVKVDFRWMDAGWYVAPDGTTPETDWWGTVGTWQLSPEKWPGKTFLESTDFARANGMKTLMWFEPERVTDPDSLVKNHGYKKEWAIVREGYNNIANNIGDSECLAWTTERICKTLRENKVEMYREDNNSDPADLWGYLDLLEGENRSGITECKFIAAHYKMWDDIIACTLSYGGCGFVDSCAGGGGRNDLESMRRGIPLLRSDFDRTTTAIRLSMTTSFNRWIPFCGTINKEKKGQLDATGTLDQYVWRASYLPAMNVDSQFVQDPNQDFGVLRRGLKEWKRVSPYLLKDFYVLTHWHTEEETTDFTAYSFYDKEKKEGVLLAFRQEECVEDTLSITLPYIELGMACIITDEDSGEVVRITGDEMQEKGFTLTFAESRTAKLLWIKGELYAY